MNGIYPKNIINKIEKDERLKNYNGRVIPYNRYEYKKIFNENHYTEILQCGYKISCLVNEYEFIPNSVTLYVWGEEKSNNIFIKNSLYEDIIIIDKKNEQMIINTIVTLLLEKEIMKKNLLNIANF